MDTRYLTLLPAIALLTTAAANDPVPRSPLSGKWQTFVLEGMATDDTHRCQIARFRERDYDLRPNDQGVTGVFGSTVWSVVFQAQGPCTIRGKTLERSDATIRVWSVSGYGTSIPMRFTATSMGCKGFFCDVLDTKPFTADLRPVREGIEETDEDNPQYHQLYQRPETFAPDVAAAIATTEQVRAAFATGQAAQVEPLLSDTMLAKDRAAFLASVPARKEQAELIEGIEPLKTFVMAPTPNNPDPRVTQVALVVANLRRVDNTKIGSLFLLSKEKGRWKLLLASTPG